MNRAFATTAATAEKPTTEHMEYWADVGDNRIGPIMRELVEAIAEMDDPKQIRRIANRLKFLSSSVNTFAYWTGEQ